jgi:hypothetical protein
VMSRISAEDRRPTTEGRVGLELEVPLVAGAAAGVPKSCSITCWRRSS